MNSNEYLKVLQKYLENLYFDALVFEQENTPIHEAKNMDLFVENSWKTLESPAYSPGLNPIENIWKIIFDNLCSPNLY